MTRFSFTPLYGSSLGFENMIREIENFLETDTLKLPTTNFPPHNIIKAGENLYVIELALAGFLKDEIDIQVQESTLTIKGEKAEGTPNVQYLHRGIATRSFTKTIKLADTIEVVGADFNNGILTISLKNIVPETKKPRKIQISNALPLNQPQLLNEQVKEKEAA